MARQLYCSPVAQREDLARPHPCGSQALRQSCRSERESGQTTPLWLASSTVVLSLRERIWPDHIPVARHLYCSPVAQREDLARPHPCGSQALRQSCHSERESGQTTSLWLDSSTAVLSLRERIWPDHTPVARKLYCSPVAQREDLARPHHCGSTALRQSCRSERGSGQTTPLWLDSSTAVLSLRERIWPDHTPVARHLYGSPVAQREDLARQHPCGSTALRQSCRSERESGQTTPLWLDSSTAVLSLRERTWPDHTPVAPKLYGSPVAQREDLARPHLCGSTALRQTCRSERGSGQTTPLWLDSSTAVLSLRERIWPDHTPVARQLYGSPVAQREDLARPHPCGSTALRQSCRSERESGQTTPLWLPSSTAVLSLRERIWPDHTPVARHLYAVLSLRERIWPDHTPVARHLYGSPVAQREDLARPHPCGSTPLLQSCRSERESGQTTPLWLDSSTAVLSLRERIWPDHTPVAPKLYGSPVAQRENLARPHPCGSQAVRQSCRSERESGQTTPLWLDSSTAVLSLRERIWPDHTPVARQLYCSPVAQRENLARPHPCGSQAVRQSCRSERGPGQTTPLWLASCTAVLSLRERTWPDHTPVARKLYGSPVAQREDLARPHPCGSQALRQSCRSERESGQTTPLWLANSTAVLSLRERIWPDHTPVARKLYCNPVAQREDLARPHPCRSERGPGQTTPLWLDTSTAVLSLRERTWPDHTPVARHLYCSPVAQREDLARPHPCGSTPLRQSCRSERGPGQTTPLWLDTSTAVLSLRERTWPDHTPVARHLYGSPVAQRENLARPHPCGSTPLRQSCRSERESGQTTPLWLPSSTAVLSLRERIWPDHIPVARQLYGSPVAQRENLARPHPCGSQALRQSCRSERGSGQTTSLWLDTSTAVLSLRERTWPDHTPVARQLYGSPVAQREDLARPHPCGSTPLRQSCRSERGPGQTTPLWLDSSTAVLSLRERTWPDHTPVARHLYGSPVAQREDLARPHPCGSTALRQSCRSERGPGQTTPLWLDSSTAVLSLRERTWPDHTPVARQLYGSLEDLQPASTFISKLKFASDKR